MCFAIMFRHSYRLFRDPNNPSKVLILRERWQAESWLLVLGSNAAILEITN